MVGERDQLRHQLVFVIILDVVDALERLLVYVRDVLDLFKQLLVVKVALPKKSIVILFGVEAQILARKSIGNLALVVVGNVLLGVEVTDLLLERLGAHLLEDVSWQLRRNLVRLKQLVVELTRRVCQRRLQGRRTARVLYQVGPPLRRDQRPVSRARFLLVSVGKAGLEEVVFCWAQNRIALEVF